MKEFIIVDGVLYRRVESFDEKVCPFCGESNFIENPEDEVFHRRLGCLKCDKWLEPVRLKEK